MDSIFSASKKKTSSPRKKTSSSHKKSRKKTSSSHKVSTPKSIPIKVKSTSPQTIEEFHLKFPEPLPNKITFDEKLSKKMSVLVNKHQDIKPFLGDALFKDIFYLYLFNKYKTNCFIAQGNTNVIPEIKIYINQDKPNINHEPLKHLAKVLVRCISKNEPIIIIPLSLKITVKEKTSGHGNLLIYRNNTRQLEHFEPHGANFQGGNEEKMVLVNETLDKDLNYLVRNMNDELDKKELLPIKLIKAHEVCPRLDGIQVLETESRLPKLPIEPDGYCVTWAMFFAEMCLKNPEIPSEQIYKAILDEREKHGSNPDYFKKMIRGYTCFINNKMAKYFTEILGFEATSEKLHSYYEEVDRTGIFPPEMTIFLYKLNYLINKELNSDSPTDNKMLKNTLKKYTSFKKTIKKSTSSSDLSSKERESRHNMRKLQGEYNLKFLDVIKKSEAREKERKATEKIRKAEEKLRKATEKQQKLEEKEKKVEEKLRKATEQAEEKKRKLEEKEKKATEKAEEKKRKEEEKLLSKTAKSKPKTSKAKTFKNKSQSPLEPNDI